jgi:hypothetical protein
VTRGEVIDADEVEPAAGRELRDVTIQQNNGDARLIQHAANLGVDGFAVWDVFQGGEEDALDLSLAELAAEIESVFSRADGSERISPENSCSEALGRACDLTADGVEDLGVAEPGCEQAEGPVGEGGCLGGRHGAEKAARASTAPDDAKILELAEGPRSSGARDGKPLGELGLAGEAAAVGVLACGNLLLERFEDGLIFGDVPPPGRRLGRIRAVFD